MRSGRGSGRGMGRGRKRQGVGYLRPALLFMLLRNDAHGYALFDGLTEFKFKTDNMDPSMIYRILRDMESFGWVESSMGEESLGPQRRIYKILPDGEVCLAELMSGLKQRREEIECLIAGYEKENKSKDKSS